MLPSISAGIKQHNDLAGIGINRGQVCAFEGIAVNTGKRQIVQIGFASMLLGDDMVRLMRKEYAGTRDTAVFATTSGSFVICRPKCLRDICPAHAALRKCCQAAALIEVTK